MRKRLEPILGGTYAIERELGGGGMSRVFLAEEMALGRKVVLKVLAEDLAAGLNAERFAQEVRLAARLQHPHIVPVLAAGHADGLPYYVMPYVEGETLRARLTRSGPLPVRDVVSVLRDVMKALSFAHSHGIVHRDIKPENVLLAGGSAVVSDFGIAKALTVSRTLGSEPLTQLGTALGTPAYMAPEQAAGDPGVDHRTDVYSCGILAYELLTGTPPFSGTSSHDFVRAHFTEPVPALRTRRADIPAQLAELVERCLAKDPRDRPASADVVLATLDALDMVVTPRTATVSAGTTVARRRVRIERLTGVAALAVVLLAAGAFALLGSRDHDGPLDASWVAVIQPQVASADAASAALATMTVDVINAGLAQLDWVRVAASPRSSSGGLGMPSAGRVAKTTAIGGRIYQVGDSLQLQLRVTEIPSGNLIRGLPPVRLGSNPSIDDLRAAVGPALSLVGYVTHPLLGPPTVPASHLPRFDAFIEFASGIEVMIRSDSASLFETLNHLREAIRMDTSFAQANLWLAFNAARSYRWPTLVREVDRLLPIIERANVQRSPFEAALTRHAVFTARGTVAAQLETLRQLSEIAPRTGFASALPNQLLDVNRPREALAALDRLFRARVAGSESWNEGRYWATRADILHFLGEYEDELKAARRARQARAADAQQVRREFRALIAIKKFTEVERRLDELNDGGGTNLVDFTGDAYLNMGQEMVAHGDEARGKRVIRRAIEWFERRTAAERQSEHVRFRAALAYLAIGEPARSLPIVEELHRAQPDDPRYLGTIGYVHAKMGRKTDAERVLAQLAAMPALSLAGSPTYERARITAALGRVSEAISLLQESLHQGQGWGIRSRLHWFTDWLPYHDNPAFRRVIAGQG